MSDNAPKSGKGRGCLGCLATVVVLALIGAIIFTVWRRAQTESLKERFAARGLPTSLQELDEWYEHVPDNENAALGFITAADAVNPPANESEHQLPIVASGDTPEYGLVLDAETALTARDYLEANTTALEKAHAAARLTRSRYPVDFTRGVAAISSSQLPILGKLRSIARLLSLEALVRAHEGNTTGATDLILDVYAVSDSLANEPMLISQLVTIAIEGIAAQHFTNVLSATPLSQSDLDRLATAAASRDPREAYRRAITGEVAFGLFDTSPMNPMSNPIYTFDRRRYAVLLEDMLDASALPLREAIAGIDAMVPGAPGSLEKQLSPFTSLMVEPMARAFDATVRAVVYRDLVQLIAAIEKYRLDHNALPDTLEALVPDYLAALPDDPYSTGPILYIQENPGYVVYSIGVDRRDGRGEKVTGTGGDINLRVTR